MTTHCLVPLFPHLCCCLQFLIVVFKYQGGRPVRCCGSEASGIQKACINENNELYWRCLVALWMFLSPVLGQTVQERSSRIFIRHLLCVSSWHYLASLHVTKFPRLSPSSFAYCQQSNSGCNEALGTRLLVSGQSFLWVQPHYVDMFNKALLHKHFSVVAYFSKLLAHFNTLVCIL